MGGGDQVMRNDRNAGARECRANRCERICNNRRKTTVKERIYGTRNWLDIVTVKSV